jgi:hypothetical protein
LPIRTQRRLEFAGASMTVEPRTALGVEGSRRPPRYPPAAALAAEAVLVVEAAGEHVRDSADLHVQRPGDSDIHSGIHAAPRERPQEARTQIITAEPVLLQSLNRWFIRMVHLISAFPDEDSDGAT